MDELLEQFLIEGRDLVAQASADLLLLSHDRSATGAIDSAFRAIHTLKGSVGIFPMGPAERVLHAAEEVLERARKRDTPLDATAVQGLTACLDAIDGWIDELDRAGELGSDAETRAADAIARLPGTGGAYQHEPSGSHDWLAELAAREEALIGSASAPLVAFHYAPDADCFFRGDDPLSIALAVPELATLALVPASGRWPPLDALEPFECLTVLEGMSTASLETVSAAFRLVADQVRFHVIDPQRARTGETAELRTGATLRVEAGRIDALARDLGELVVAANALGSLADEAAAMDRALGARIRAAQAEIDGKLGKLRQSVGRVRLVPLGPALRRLPRMVREIAASLGKHVTFTISGETLEVDKQIADALFEPLLHLVRNALDHGIEDEAARTRAGKPAEGAVTLVASRDGDAVLVTLSDDGRGIDPARMRDVAVARGVLSSEAARQLSDAAAVRLIFSAGLTTAEKTTGISGRGVGMDAVASAIEALRGTIDVESVPGQGTAFRLRLPANALTTRVLVVEVGPDRYGVALDQIVETVRIDRTALTPIGGGLACELRGRTVPVLSLATLLGGTETPSARAKLVVTRAGDERVALRVDGFAERLDAVVQPPTGILAGLPGLAGSALLGDGSVLLVLDLAELAA